jgi:hypothetical protein
MNKEKRPKVLSNHKKKGQPKGCVNVGKPKTRWQEELCRGRNRKESRNMKGINDKSNSYMMGKLAWLSGPSTSDILNLQLLVYFI